MERLGILGGTFDPPHQGHLVLAQAALHQLDLDSVLWAPAGSPPHKQERLRGPETSIHPPSDHDIPAPVNDRLEMVELAISDQPQMSLCRLDLDRPGPHYTADLLDLLRALHPPSTQFWFLVGEDSLRELAKWHAPRRILASCRLAVYPRSGPPIRWENLEAVIPDIRELIDWLRGPAFACSSSKIRRDIQAGRTVEDRLLPAVMAYIEEHGLYRT